MLDNIRILDSVAILIINLYQKYLSPYKGYRCAYSVLYNGNSCSVSVVQLIETHGVFGGWENIKNQFVLCYFASSKLESEGEEKNKKNVASQLMVYVAFQLALYLNFHNEEC